jgi:hypothetical protein
MNYPHRTDRTLSIDGRRIESPGPIQELVEYNDRLVILVEGYTGWKSTDPAASRNIWCYDKHGNLLWQIEDPETIGTDPAGRKIYDSFVALYRREDTGELWANTSAMRFVIDKDTGKIVHAELKDWQKPTGR